MKKKSVLVPRSLSPALPAAFAQARRAPAAPEPMAR